LLREFKVHARVGRPQVAYTEAITKEVEQETRFIRQSGGRGQYGHCWLRIKPNEPGEGFVFVNSIVGGSIPREYIKPIEEGIKEAMSRGVIAGYPVVDLTAEVYDGSYHEVDSSEVAFKIAASMAFQDGFKKADPVILEPIMKVEVTTPDDFMGDVIGDLNSKRGTINVMEDRPGGIKHISAFVPLGSMFGYTTSLRSMSQGRAAASMEFAHYAEVPRNVTQEIIEKRAK